MSYDKPHQLDDEIAKARRELDQLQKRIKEMERRREQIRQTVVEKLGPGKASKK